MREMREMNSTAGGGGAQRDANGMCDCHNEYNEFKGNFIQFLSRMRIVYYMCANANRNMQTKGCVPTHPLYNNNAHTARPVCRVVYLYISICIYIF